MSSTGIDRETGKPLRGIAHVTQSLIVIISTRFVSRFMRRTFGSAVPPLLGRNIVPETFLRFAAALIVAIDLWEPRLKVTQITFPGFTNSAAHIRRGRVGIAILGQYRPDGHLGDPTPAGPDDILFL